MRRCCWSRWCASCSRSRQANSGITFDPIDFVDSDAPNSIDANSDTGLGRALQAASKNSGGGSDLVLVRAINPNGVLGIAGGIPSAPGLKNNPRTGAVFATSLLCAGVGYTLESLGQTAAHELNHSFGLSHAIESRGQTDALGDGVNPSGVDQAGQGEPDVLVGRGRREPDGRAGPGAALDAAGSLAKPAVCCGGEPLPSPTKPVYLYRDDDETSDLDRPVCAASDLG